MADIVPDCPEVSISPEQLKNSVLVKHVPTGKVGYRIKRIEAAEADVVPYIGCAEFNLSDGQMIRLGIGLNDNGKACIILIEEAD